MIKNEVQYRTAIAAAERFRHAIAELKQHPRVGGRVHPRLARAEGEALESQLGDLLSEIEAYEARAKK